MRVKAYVLVAMVVFLNMSFGEKNAKPTEGVNPGDIVPRIKSLGNENYSDFQNRSGQYTFLNFWAAFDAESRLRNVRLMNEISQLNPEGIIVRSFSLDEKKSIFIETIKIDGLDTKTQGYVEGGTDSEFYKKYCPDNKFCNYLINEEGLIIESNVTPERLKEIMKLI